MIDLKDLTFEEGRWTGGAIEWDLESLKYLNRGLTVKRANSLKYGT